MYRCGTYNMDLTHMHVASVLTYLNDFGNGLVGRWGMGCNHLAQDNIHVHLLHNGNQQKGGACN